MMVWRRTLSLNYNPPFQKFSKLEMALTFENLERDRIYNLEYNFLPLSAYTDIFSKTKIPQSNLLNDTKFLQYKV